MKTLLPILSLLSLPALSAEVYVTTPDNIQPEGYVVLDAPGIVRFNNVVDPAYVWLASGVGEKFYEVKRVPIASYPFYADRSTFTGYQCTDACSVYFKEKYVSPSCPGDGATLTYPSLAFTLDGVEFYSEPVRTVDTVCWVTPAPYANRVWTAPVLTFTNPSTERASATTLFTLTDANYLYSKHTFEITGNVSCSALLKNVGTRFVKRWVETGFQCTATLDAGEVAQVVVR